MNYEFSRQVMRSEARSAAKDQASTAKRLRRREAGRELQKRSVTDPKSVRFVAMTAVTSLSKAFGQRTGKRARIFA